MGVGAPEDILEAWRAALTCSTACCPHAWRATARSHAGWPHQSTQCPLCRRPRPRAGGLHLLHLPHLQPRLSAPPLQGGRNQRTAPGDNPQRPLHDGAHARHSRRAGAGNFDAYRAVFLERYQITNQAVRHEQHARRVPGARPTSHPPRRRRSTTPPAENQPQDRQPDSPTRKHKGKHAARHHSSHRPWYCSGRRRVCAHLLIRPPDYRAVALWLDGPASERPRL